jgi:hypothetical protein
MKLQSNPIGVLHFVCHQYWCQSWDGGKLKLLLTYIHTHTHTLSLSVCLQHCLMDLSHKREK